jgi:beta-glucosidase
MVTRIVASWYQLNQDQDHREPNFSSWTKNTTGFIYFESNEPPIGVINQHVNVQGNHKELARTIATDSITLLKNNDNILPLKAGRQKKIGVYGIDGGPTFGGPNAFVDQGGNNGTLAMGWGSGTVSFSNSASFTFF